MSRIKKTMGTALHFYKIVLRTPWESGKDRCSVAVAEMQRKGCLNREEARRRGVGPDTSSSDPDERSH